MSKPPFLMDSTEILEHVVAQLRKLGLSDESIKPLVKDLMEWQIGHPPMTPEQLEELSQKASQQALTVQFV